MLAYNRKREKGTPKPSTIAIYASVFALIVAVVAVGYQAPQQTDGIANAATIGSDNQTSQKTSVNELVATNIAANLAETTNLSVAANVANLSVSLKAKSDLTQSNEAVIAKPQILQPTAQSRTILAYTAKAGDTVESLATQYGISKETIKWANNLTSDAIAAGQVIQILPIDGVRYTVKTGDTIQSIAQKYNVDQSRIVLFNDLEVTGLTNGAKIILPRGNLPETERPGYVAPRVATYGYNSTPSSPGSSTGNFFNASAGNRYAVGYCTWYVYERRAQLGMPIGSFWGDASSWAYSASSAGYTVNRTPSVGAIMQNGGGAGHVAIVESVLSNGDVVLSEMNYGGGWNQIHRGRVVSAGQATLYNYIH
ncbi:LysM peptidoglycan-binding domain-containing protein [Candidatus Saccharibacteria bacterium]|nr:LysM peptidoglycan-binding domain-containing protein [Candidatus Saccharibacteria bacterium]